MRVPLFWRVVPVYILIALFFAVPVMQRKAAIVHAQQAGQQAESQLATRKAKDSKVVGQPQRIVIPRLGIDLGVVPGNYRPGSATWSVSGSLANYAVTTAVPNTQHDKSLIYGHWTQQVFGPTKNLVVGDTAYLYTSGGHLFEYIYEGNVVIKPTNTAVFKSFKGKPGLVLMTCQGAWAQDRRLMFFNLVQAS